MKLLIAILLIGSSSVSLCNELAGSWQGTGSWFRSSLKQGLPVIAELKLEMTESTLNLLECFKSTSSSQNSERKCLASSFEIRDESIYMGENKVGDIYPSRIIIFYGNSQVSEQIILRAGSKGTLDYQYSYANLDGENNFRKISMVKQ